jgi:hypothetical protein
MPAAKVNRPSVAPVAMVGMSGTPGQSFAATVRMGPVMASVSAGGVDTSAVPTGVILRPGSASKRVSDACTSAMGTPGSIRQFTVAVARWGRAFGAWPPLTCVGTQVVRNMLFQPLSAAATRSAAARSPRSDESARMSAACAGVTFAISAK